MSRALCARLNRDFTVLNIFLSRHSRRALWRVLFENASSPFAVVLGHVRRLQDVVRQPEEFLRFCFFSRTFRLAIGLEGLSFKALRDLNDQKAYRVFEVAHAAY